LSEDVDGDGWITELQGKSVPAMRKTPVNQQFVLIGRTQVCATGDDGERCAEPGEVRRCQTVQAFVGCQCVPYSLITFALVVFKFTFVHLMSPRKKVVHELAFLFALSWKKTLSLSTMSGHCMSMHAFYHASAQLLCSRTRLM